MIINHWDTYPPVRGEAQMKSTLTRADALIAVTVGVIALALYVRTTAVGVLGSDSGEFQVLGFLTAHAHTTGYWVYLLLVKAFTIIPFDDIATRVSFFSAWMGAVTAACTYLAGRLLSGSRWAGALGAAALVVGANFWSQSIIAEVYTAGSAFAAGVLLLLLAWEQSRRSRLLFWAALLGAVSPGVHGTVILAAPAVVGLILSAKPDWRRVWKPILGGAALGLALLVGAFLVCDRNTAPYNMMNTTYIPAREAFDTSLEELQTPAGRFIFLITSRQWNSAMFRDIMLDTQEQADIYYSSLPSDFSIVVIVLMGLGFISLWPKHPRLGVFFLLAGLAHHLFVFNYRIGDRYAFYISWYPYASALAAAGLGFLTHLVLGRLPKWKFWLRPALGILALVLAVAPFARQGLAFVREGEAYFEGKSFPSRLARNDWYYLISATVKELPENAVVFVDWYNLYPYYYAAYVEQGRTDLAFHEPVPYSIKGRMAKTMVQFALEEAKSRPVYALFELEEFDRAGLEERFVWVGPTRLVEFRYP